jgi:hypothetical protein
MKAFVASAFICLQFVPSHAFQFNFELPFGLNSFFRKPPSPELFALHKGLIEIPSITGEEHDVGVYLAEYLEKRNYTVEKIPR